MAAPRYRPSTRAKGCTMTNGWHQDVLGPEWVARTLDLPAGDTATLVRKVTPPAGGERRRRAVLYVHGFVDYFFQAHLGDAFEDHGYAFYAIDLRGYGRSLAHWTEAGKDPNMVDDLSVYAQDLDAAAATIRAEGHDELVVVGHSTGGSSRACGPTRDRAGSPPSCSTARGSTSTRAGSTAWSPPG